jgi:hypothetical protein
MLERKRVVSSELRLEASYLVNLRGVVRRLKVLLHFMGSSTFLENTW